MLLFLPQVEARDVCLLVHSLQIWGFPRAKAKIPEEMKTLQGNTIKVIKIFQELVVSEHKAYPKHQRER